MIKKLLPLLLVSSVLNATSLIEIIQSTLDNNDNIKASMLSNQSKKKSFDSVKNIYTPTATIGSNYTRLDLDTRASQVGITTNAF